jgi:hypothetical protein
VEPYRSAALPPRNAGPGAAAGGSRYLAATAAPLEAGDWQRLLDALVLTLLPRG